MLAQSAAVYNCAGLFIRAQWTPPCWSVTICAPRGAALMATKNRVQIYKGWCKKCGICVAFCPPEVLDTGPDGYPFVSKPDQCTGCGWCEIRCPDFAIVVDKDETTPEE